MVRAALGKELKSKFVYHKKMKTGKNMMLTASFANVGEAVFGALFPHAGTAKRVSIDEAHVGLKPLVKSLRCALQSAPAHTRPAIRYSVLSLRRMSKLPRRRRPRYGSTLRLLSSSLSARHALGFLWCMP